MKEIIAVIKMNKINQTKAALAEAGLVSFTAKDASGRGRGLVDYTVLRGAEVGYEEAIAQLGSNQRLVSKRLLLIVVPDKLVRKTIDAIINTNRTGKSGDGKIFVLPMMNAIRIRTGEEGDDALDEI